MRPRFGPRANSCDCNHGAVQQYTLSVAAGRASLKTGPFRIGRLTDKVTRSTEALQGVLQRALPGALPSASGLLPQLQDALPKLRMPGLRTPSAPFQTQPSGAAFLSGTYSNAAGSRPYRLYVPSRRAARAPLLVMLHGCTQTPEDFAAGTRMNSLAEEAGMLVLYPAQVASANQQRCWNWFNPADQQRDSGEPALIAGMARQVIAEHEGDPARVFVAGLSAGGAQAAIMARTYPDLFAAIGVHSGLACGAANDMVSAFAAMRQGKPGQGQHAVPCIIFHGDADHTVNLRNAAAVAGQAGVAGQAEVTQGRVPGGLAYTRTSQRGSTGRAVEQWVVHGAGHAWSGGSPDGSYTEPRGPDASREMLRFFLEAAGQKRG